MSAEWAPSAPFETAAAASTKKTRDAVPVPAAAVVADSDRDRDRRHSVHSAQTAKGLSRVWQWALFQIETVWMGIRMELRCGRHCYGQPLCSVPMSMPRAQRVAEGESVRLHSS